MERKLMQLKEKIDKAEKDLQQLKGEKKQLLQRLKEEFGLSSIAEATKELQDMQKDLKILEEQIDKEYNDIVEKYDQV